MSVVLFGYVEFEGFATVAPRVTPLGKARGQKLSVATSST